MLTRLRLKRNFRPFVRYLADKNTDNDDKTPENKSDSKNDEKKPAESSTEKIQALLKSMMTAPKISESEYRERFTVAPDRRQRKSDQIETKTEKIEEKLTKAAADVALVIGGDVKQTEAELLSRVLGKINQTSTNLSDLIIGMKVDRTREGEDLAQQELRETRGQQVKRMLKNTRTREESQTRFAQRKSMQIEDREDRKSLTQSATVDIFSGQPLGIFKAKELNYGTKLDVWDSLNQRELKQATSQPPGNYFEKMILWTEQGKVWKFPINNEQGMDEEQNVSFSEHVFVDANLEDWCPKRGPIRHYMELVCVGLSKNAFYTLQEKKDHILWYKEYFESKKDLLTEVGAWDNEKSASPKASV